PVQLNVIQANTLLAPEGVQNLFGGEFSIAIDKHKYALNTQIFEDVLLFDTALQVCDDLAETTIRQKVETIQVFETILRKQYKNGGLSQQVIESFYKLYLGFKLVRENNRDSIWKFIVQNLYKPYFFAGKFDYIIGNPPWFTFSSVRNEEYQNTLNAIAENYSVKPERKANFPHLEIAAIFLAYCSSYFLKENGQIAFVLPRSFLNADHHENTRAGKSLGFRLTHIWDFEKVKPLFRIPCCVLFADKSNGKNQVSADGIDGITFSGNIPSHNCNYSAASNVLAEQNVSWFYIKQGKSTAFSTSDRRQIKSVNPYKQLFKQGATIVPRPFYFVELDQQIPPDWRDRIVNLKTSAEIEADGKKPWKGIELNGKMESLFLFRTALSKSILPFALHKPALVTLPVTLTDSEENGNRIAIHSADELLQLGYMNASRWFKKAENIWNILRTAKNKKISFEDYLNWQNKLTNQKLDSPFLVLYNSSAKDANAVMVRRKDFDLPFIVESKAYWFATDSIYEAFYLSAVLNSSLVNQSMKAFQTRGLFGPRDVHKKILDIVFPRYNEKKSRHFKLAQLGTECHELARQFLLENPPEQNLSAYHLGRIRLEIKKHLDGNLIQIDRFVKEII
ncbi:MAG: restriction endonuclease, partial [Bacteroidota bacterium]